MHLQYRISLPDHSWVKAARHKLIPSIYAGIVIKKGGFGDPTCVTHSGPSKIFVRSGKHDSSNANTHAYDFTKILESKLFEELCMTETER